MKMMVDGVEIELQKYNVDDLEKLIEKLRSQPTGGPGPDSLCDNLRKELLKQQGISLPTIITLSRWCHTGGTCAKAVPIAKEISELLFKEILPRLD